MAARKMGNHHALRVTPTIFKNPGEDYLVVFVWFGCGSAALCPLWLGLLKYHLTERRKLMKDLNYREMAPQFLKQVEEGAFLVVKGKDRVNIMTIGWAMVGVVWRRPILMVAVRTSRFTHGIIEGADSFTVSAPTGDMKKEINFCGSKSGRDLDKFKECRLSTTKAKKVSTPILIIPGYHFECRITHKTPMDPKILSADLEKLYPAKDYHTLYFGEILASYLTE